VKKEKIYPESGVELSPFISRHYDRILTLASLGYYPRTIGKAIRDMNVRPEDRILDLGCGTGSNDYLMTGYMNENGGILGLDISEEMRTRFQRRFQGDGRVRFLEQRIDQPFQLGEAYDKVLISFVIHGFPHEVRQVVIENAKKHLKTGGSFFILDYSEFDMASMPALHRRIFKTVECIYAFDFIERDWKTILTQHGFSEFREHFYLKRYMRLLEAVLK
jgi:demethylmenaquinone methyltransferase/2-methoxy-6-polyprenyl-1,4-benzoquinol methylase